MTPQEVRDLVTRQFHSTPLTVLAMEHELMPLLLELWEALQRSRVSGDQRSHLRLDGALEKLGSFQPPVGKVIEFGGRG